MASNMIGLSPSGQDKYGLAQAMLQQSMKPEPIRTHLQGIGKLAQALSASHRMSQLSDERQGNISSLTEALASPEGLNNPDLISTLMQTSPELGLNLAGQNRMFDFEREQAAAEAAQPNTEVGRLLAEMEMLPPGDPRRDAYAQRINVITTRQPGTSVTVNMPPMERAFAQAVGGAQGNQLVDLMENAYGAQDTMLVLDQIESVLNATNQGAFEPAKAELASLAQGLGMDPASLGLDGPANAQTIQAGVNQLVLTQAERMSGVLSDSDIQLLRQTAPQLSNDPAANAAIIGNLRGQLSQSVERAQGAMEYGQEHGNLMGFSGIIPNVPEQQQGQQQEQPPADMQAPAGQVPATPPPVQIPTGQETSIQGDGAAETYPSAPPQEVTVTEQSVRDMPLTTLSRLPPEAFSAMDDATLEYLLAPGVFEHLTDEQVRAIAGAING